MNPRLKRAETVLLLLAFVLTPILILGLGVWPWATLLIAGSPLCGFELAVAARASLGLRALRRASASSGDEAPTTGSAYGDLTAWQRDIVARLEQAYAANPPSDEEWEAIMQRVAEKARLETAAESQDPPCRD